MFKRSFVSAVAALSLLSGSAAMAAGSGAASLSVADSVRAAAPMSEANDQFPESTALIGVGIFVVIVALFYVLAENEADGRSESP